MYLKIILLLCLCSNPPSPLPPNTTLGQSYQPQSESVSTNSMDRYHIRHIFEPTRQESLTSLKNDLENHLEDFELVSHFLCKENSIFPQVRCSHTQFPFRVTSYPCPISR